MDPANTELPWEELEQVKYLFEKLKSIIDNTMDIECKLDAATLGKVSFYANLTLTVKLLLLSCIWVPALMISERSSIQLVAVVARDLCVCVWSVPILKENNCLTYTHTHLPAYFNCHVYNNTKYTVMHI